MNKIYPKKTPAEKLAIIGEMRALIEDLRKKAPCSFYHKTSKFQDSYILIDQDLNVAYLDIIIGNGRFNRGNVIRDFSTYQLSRMAEELEKNNFSLDSNRYYYNADSIIQRLSYGEHKIEVIKKTLDRISDQIKDVPDFSYDMVKQNTLDFMKKMYRCTEKETISQAIISDFKGTDVNKVRSKI